MHDRLALISKQLGCLRSEYTSFRHEVVDKYTRLICSTKAVLASTTSRQDSKKNDPLMRRLEKEQEKLLISIELCHPSGMLSFDGGYSVRAHNDDQVEVLRIQNIGLQVFKTFRNELSKHGGRAEDGGSTVMKQTANLLFTSEEKIREVSLAFLHVIKDTLNAENAGYVEVSNLECYVTPELILYPLEPDTGGTIADKKLSRDPRDSGYGSEIFSPERTSVLSKPNAASSSNATSIPPSLPTTTNAAQRKRNVTDACRTSQYSKSASSSTKSSGTQTSTPASVKPSRSEQPCHQRHLRDNQVAVNKGAYTAATVVAGAYTGAKAAVIGGVAVYTAPYWVCAGLGASIAYGLGAKGAD